LKYKNKHNHNESKISERKEKKKKKKETREEIKTTHTPRNFHLKAKDHGHHPNQNLIEV
jgi:hypothetical protein